MAENVRTWKVGEDEYALESSMGANIAYRGEFWGRLEPPYKGDMNDDLLAIYRGAQPTVTETDKRGKETEVPNPDHRGVDLEALLRVAWAMAHAVDPAAGKPFDGGYEEFRAAIIHQPAGLWEEVDLYNIIMFDLAMKFNFRQRQGQSGAGDADDKKE